MINLEELAKETRKKVFSVPYFQDVDSDARPEDLKDVDKVIVEALKSVEFNQQVQMSPLQFNITKLLSEGFEHSSAEDFAKELNVSVDSVVEALNCLGARGILKFKDS